MVQGLVLAAWTVLGPQSFGQREPPGEALPELPALPEECCVLVGEPQALGGLGMGRRKTGAKDISHPVTQFHMSWARFI